MLKLQQTKVEEPTLTIRLKVTPAEMTVLKQLARKTGTTPASILEDFTADLTNSWRNGGSDERLYAFDWFKRRGYAAKHISANQATDWLESIAGEK